MWKGQGEPIPSGLESRPPLRSPSGLASSPPHVRGEEGRQAGTVVQAKDARATPPCYVQAFYSRQTLQDIS